MLKLYRAKSQAILAAAALVAACPSPQVADRKVQDLPGQGPAPTPPPPFSSVDAASHDEILAYARGLRYDTRTGVADSQALAVATRPGGKCPAECTYGAVASIHPEVGSLGLTDADLKTGRVIARVVSADDKPYEKFNLGKRDTVYIWVDMASGPRARLVSTDPARFDRSKRDVRLTIEGPHPEAQRYAQSTARFIWAEEDEHLWISCLALGCCRVEP